MARWRSCRIGVDLDSHNQLQLLKAYFNAKSLFPRSRIEVKQTGHGFHIRIFRKVSVKQNFEVRRMLNDDPMRIAIDEKRVRWGLTDWIDTLFEWKMKDGKITKEENYNVLALPFTLKFPCRKGRVK